MPRPSHQLWLTAQAAIGLPLLVALAFLPDHDPVTVGIRWSLVGLPALSFLWLWRVLDVRGTVADRVTAGRMACLLAAAAAILAVGSGPALWSLLLLAVLADLADGLAARRWGGSPAGAVLDMETDQLVTLVLAMLAVAAGRGPHWLLLPAFKYAYQLLALAGLPVHEPRPVAGDNRRGRAVCALVMGCLLAATCPFAPAGLVAIAGPVAVAALFLSFGSDAVFLLRRRTPATAE